ncbi:MAG: DUF401 family protein, partial [candidate division Zixibacteria bacterium]|nr:DUF401 family protein [candidate division Zixibacteria bacterium]
MLLTWTGFVVSLAAILVISRKNLAVGLISGGVVLGLIVLPFDVLWGRIVYTFTDPEIIMLALAMGVIPVLGGVMLDSGQVDSLVSNVRLRKRYLLPFSAALMGLLPMPGGALLSAPILQKGGEGVPDDLKAVINNWFRHLFLLVYPLNSALIVLSQIAGLDMYRAILYVLPGFAVALALGYLFFLRRVHGSHHHTEDFSWGGLLLPFSIILVAPMLDFTLKRTLSLGAAATLIAVSMSLILAVSVSRNRLELKAIVRRMKPWNFA